VKSEKRSEKGEKRKVRSEKRKEKLKVREVVGFANYEGGRECGSASQPWAGFRPTCGVSHWSSTRGFYLSKDPSPQARGKECVDRASKPGHSHGAGARKDGSASQTCASPPYIHTFYSTDSILFNPTRTLVYCPEYHFQSKTRPPS
jgi:hypothetical protein